MLSIPVYRRNGVFYFHARVNGRQVKRSLRTGDPLLAKLRAVQLLGVLDMHRPKLSDFNFDSASRKYEIDLASGKLKADGPDDHALMMEALSKLASLQISPQAVSTEAPAAVPAPQPRAPLATSSRLTLSQLASKFFGLKSSLSEGTKTDYAATAKEFDTHCGDLILPQVTDATVTSFMEYLAGKGNTPRTIDKKVGAVRALFNFAIKQKLYTGANPAADRNLLSKKEKRNAGSRPFDMSDLQTLFACQRFQDYRTKDPDFYWLILSGVITGIRVTALSAITDTSLKVSPQGVPYIQVDKDKTAAGRRSVPVPQEFFDGLKSFLDQSKRFVYEDRPDGKGASDPVRKELDRHKKAIKFEAKGQTFHGFRKTLNTYLMHEKVPFEVRCQFIGHEFDHVNKQVYAEQFSTEEVAGFVVPVQRKLLQLLKFST